MRLLRPRSWLVTIDVLRVGEAGKRRDKAPLCVRASVDQPPHGTKTVRRVMTESSRVGS